MRLILFQHSISEERRPGVGKPLRVTSRPSLEQFNRLDAKGFGEARDYEQGGVPLSAFSAADVGPVALGSGGWLGSLSLPGRGLG